METNKQETNVVRTIRNFNWWAAPDNCPLDLIEQKPLLRNLPTFISSRYQATPSGQIPKIKIRIEYILKGSGHLEWPGPQNFSYLILVPNIKALPNLPTFISSRYQATPGGQIPNDKIQD